MAEALILSSLLQDGSQSRALPSSEWVAVLLFVCCLYLYFVIRKGGPEGGLLLGASGVPGELQLGLTIAQCLEHASAHEICAERERERENFSSIPVKPFGGFI